jgi:hypothetical protein
MIRTCRMRPHLVATAMLAGLAYTEFAWMRACLAYSAAVVTATTCKQGE